MTAVIAVFSGFASAVQLEYDNLHRITRSDYGNGTVIEWSYDAAGNQEQRTVSDNRRTIDVTVDPPNAGTVTGAGVALWNTNKSLSASPAGGFLFSGWFESGVLVSANPILTFTVGNSRTLTAKFIPLAPKIAVFDSQAGVNVEKQNHGSLSLGSVVIGTTATRTILIRNSGNATLANLSPSISGSAASDFVISQPPSTIPPAGEATLTLRFSPTAPGPRQASVQIASNDADENPFEILISGIGKNTPPTISHITDKMTDEDTPLSGISFTVGDAQTAAGSLIVTATSSNHALLADAGIVIGSGAANRTLSLQPLPNQFGSTAISVTVTDEGGLTATDTFNLVVNSVNDAPTITAIPNQIILPGASTGVLTFTVSDVETPANSLTLTKASSNLALVPEANIVLGGTGGNRTVTVVPTAGQLGSASISIIVTDEGGSTASTTFSIQVMGPVVLFSDNFDDNQIDASKWLTSGSTVSEAGQLMRVETAVSDHGGGLTSVSFVAPSNELITIERRVFLHASAPVTMPTLAINFGDVPLFGVDYADINWSSPPTYLAAHGVYIFRDSGSPHIGSSVAKTSPPVPAIWDTWFNEKLVYNPVTGVLSQYVNGTKQIDYNVGKPTATGLVPMKLTFTAWGWGTGQQHLFDDLVVSRSPGSIPNSLIVSCAAQINPADGKTYFTVIYQKFKGQSGFAYELETSADLMTWNLAGADAEPLGTVANGDMQIVTTRILPCIGTEGIPCKFVRVRVTHP